MSLSPLLSSAQQPPFMEDLAAEGASTVSGLRCLRWVSILLGLGNVGLILMGGFLMVSATASCFDGGDRIPLVAVSLSSVVRLFFMVWASRAQRATAETIVGHRFEGSPVINPIVRHERRVRYRRWLWWTRFGMVVNALQFATALYLMFIIVRDLSSDGNSKKCIEGQNPDDRSKKRLLIISYLVLVWLVVIIQCLTGSDVLRWRSFYATHDTAWKAHYQEVFDHGIREAFCCMGRAKYMSVLEEDEIYSVARLLGDLVAYRASGTGHLELLAGLALLQRRKQSTNSYSEFMEAPKARIHEAALFHPFAEAAYTGPLLDFGRNLIMFPCVWLHRQGILTPWTRNRRPVLEGDNWWRGHAAAFLKYVKLSPEALRLGRVCQTKLEAAYFIVVLHDLRSVVIAVRGTETPEDLITDGLCKECTLSTADLDGLINNDQVPPHVRGSILSSPHYGHSGIVESARELFKQIDGPGDEDDSPTQNSGFLSSLMGNGGECHGYNIRVVGHSLGGSVATLLGIKLFGRYPNLHVFAYGPLPCLDSVLAEACSDFVTSIVYNDEFSARLSVNSILRLRASAISALSVDSSADSAMISKLVRRVLHVNKYHENGERHKSSSPSPQPGTMIVEDNNHIHKRRHLKYTIKGGAFLCGHAVSCMINMPDHHTCSHEKDISRLASTVALEPEGLSDKGVYDGPVFDDSKSDIGGFNDYNSELLIDCNFEQSNGYEATLSMTTDGLSPFRGQSSSYSDVSPLVGVSPEMYVAGLIVHIIPEERSILPLWKTWRVSDRHHGYRAFVANRESFKDIVVTPYMFLDHLPWRCNYALQRVLERWETRRNLDNDMFNEASIV